MNLLALHRTLGLACALLLALPSLAFAQRAAVTGRVTDARSGEGLPGANVVVSVAGSLTAIGGAAADDDGAYRVTGLDAGTYTLAFRYIGYAEQRREVTLTTGQTLTLNVALSEEGLSLNEAVVTASRQQEQVLDAPASVSVIGPAQIQASVTPSSVGVIRNTTGVDMAQTGVDRQEVVLRGFNNAFSGAAYTLVDYRQAAVASLNVNVFSIMPNQPSDLERVEVVRGPGSALYGAGVDAGVIHFITKDPFSSPGTTLTVTGGERSLLGIEGRHAGTIGARFGYKLSGAFTRADDWTFNARDANDSLQLASDFVLPASQQPEDYQAIDATRRLQRDYDYMKIGLSGLAQYRLNPTTTLSVNGGYSTFDGIVLSGIGTLQGKGFGYTYGQVRLQSGAFFAQGYFNKNDAGQSYVYGTGMTVVDKGIQYVAQTQYDWAPSDALRVIVGADADLTRPDTEGTILGRNEDDDTVVQYGAYTQASYDLTDALNLTGALRADYNNIITGLDFSPRAALVYKLSPTNSARITYNRAFSSPGTNSLFLDIAGRVTSFGTNPFSSTERQFILLGRGAAQGQTFNNFRQNNTVRFFLPFNGAFGQDYNLGALPAQPIYLLTTASLSSLVANNQAPAQLSALSAQQKQAFLGVMQAFGQAAGTSTVPGQLGIPTSVYKCPEDPGASFYAYCSVSGPTDIAPLKQTTTQTAEVGYKGLFANKLLFEVDAYYTEKKNFIGPLLLETPLAFLQNDAVNRNLETLLSNPQVQAALANYRASGANAVLSEDAARGLIGVIFSRTNAAVVQPDEQVLNGGNANQVGGFLSYRNFGRVKFWGVDASAQIAPTSRTNLFVNGSFVSDDFFDNEELGEAGNANLNVALNAPRFKLKSGFSYAVPQAWSANVSVRYQDGFPVASGPYAGDVPAFTLVDVGAGYDFSNALRGLRADVLVQNVLNDRHREFIGAPLLGRMALVRLGFTF